MLKQRVATAAILIPLVVVGLFGLTGGAFALFTGAVVLLSAWEWANLAGFERTAARLGYVLALALSMLMIWRSGAAHAAWLLWLSAIGWLFNLYWVVRYPQDREQWHAPPIRLAMGLWVLLPCWVGFIQLRASGIEWLLYVLLLVWLADIGAYFAGRRFGRRKLAPRVSPGKSWEGVYGGLVAVALLAVGFSAWAELAPGERVWLILASLLVALISVLGDLFESMLKRLRGLKDSGNLLPGHGGVLDRIDSLTAAVPLFALFRLWG
ncbi:MAG TPA: phosphatidate cytidylyltransferase [Modicisalibacter sp.]|nr:phosphatidate cytidylyltransferase [Modicisalibacter sp.]